MFLGIAYDFWHIIIPVVTLVVLIPVFFLKVDKRFALMWFLVMILSLIALQFYYEWSQIPSYMLYGGITDFIANSKHDIKLFVIGMFAGSFAGFLVYSIIYRLTNKKD